MAQHFLTANFFFKTVSTNSFLILWFIDYISFLKWISYERYLGDGILSQTVNVSYPCISTIILKEC